MREREVQMVWEGGDEYDLGSKDAYKKLVVDVWSSWEINLLLDDNNPISADISFTWWA